MRETFVIHSRLSWRQVRGVAAIKRQHGLQALAIEHLAARLAGGFLQPINSDSLKEAIGEAIATDLGEFNNIKRLPGFPRASAATLQKAWEAGLKFTELAKTSDALVRSRIDAVTRLETEVLKRLPPSMRRPADLVDLALQHLRHAKTLRHWPQAWRSGPACGCADDRGHPHDLRGVRSELVRRSRSRAYPSWFCRRVPPLRACEP